MPTSPDRAADVVVVGGGAVGASIAYESARRGASVMVLDGGPHPATGCSYANAGLLSPSHVEPLATPANVAAGLRFLFSPRSPFHVRPDPRLVPWLARFVRSAAPERVRRLTARMQQLATRSLALHAGYAAAGLETGYQQLGSLDVYSSPERWERAATHVPAGAQLLDAAEARRLEPAVGEVAGAVHHPEDAQVDSRRFVRALLEAAQRDGARVRWGVAVTRLLRHGDRVTGVETPDGTFTAGHVVLAAGLGSAGLARGAGLRLPLRGAKGYVLDLDVAEGAPRIPVTFKERRVVATPYPDRLRLCGTLELGSDSAPMHAGRVQAIRDAGLHGLPGLRPRRTVETWAGLRPSTPDGVPALGRSARRPGLVVATGHGMWGIVLAPITAEMVARDILEGAPVLDEPAFTPDRFSGLRLPDLPIPSSEDDLPAVGLRQRLRQADDGGSATAAPPRSTPGAR
ncbi:NAD(P)/FAD-dependent oxidoreductase [Pseudonocardia nigra]|uniref:NAD(P)/FAD-dependent oxidoreductase n=1 Tax=Pseudonocardia nigra TaxID=1921578 RepID=UPI001C5D64EB|nr:FAD-dependent oxidoreductase [Pseudonocardia nigra]